MNHVTPTTPTPPPGAVLHLLYLDEDNALTERLVRIKRADKTHWLGVDLVKNKFRNFRRAGLFWAKPLADAGERQDVLYRLLVRQLLEQPLQQNPKI